MMCKNIELKKVNVDVLLGCFRTDGEHEFLKLKVKKLKDGSKVNFVKEEYEVLADLASYAWREDEMAFNYERYYSSCYARQWYGVTESLSDDEYYRELISIKEALSDVIDILWSLINE